MVVYYYDRDEIAFFEWLSRMPCVESYEGCGRDLFIRLKRRPGKNDLWELLAFFHRYNIDMKQLARYENSRNRSWFCDPKMYWYKKVFGSGAKRTTSKQRQK